MDVPQDTDAARLWKTCVPQLWAPPTWALTALASAPLKSTGGRSAALRHVRLEAGSRALSVLQTTPPGFGRRANAHACARMHPCTYSSMQVSRHSGTQACEHAHRYPGMQICRHATMQECKPLLTSRTEHLSPSICLPSIKLHVKLGMGCGGGLPLP